MHLAVTERVRESYRGSSGVAAATTKHLASFRASAYARSVLTNRSLGDMPSPSGCTKLRVRASRASQSIASKSVPLSPAVARAVAAS